MIVISSTKFLEGEDKKKNNTYQIMYRYKSFSICYLMLLILTLSCQFKTTYSFKGKYVDYIKTETTHIFKEMQKGITELNIIKFLILWFLFSLSLEIAQNIIRLGKIFMNGVLILVCCSYIIMNNSNIYKMIQDIPSYIK